MTMKHFCSGFAIPVDLIFHWPKFASAANVAPRDSRVDFGIKRLGSKLGTRQKPRLYQGIRKLSTTRRDFNINCVTKKLWVKFCKRSVNFLTVLLNRVNVNSSWQIDERLELKDKPPEHEIWYCNLLFAPNIANATEVE